MDYNWNNNDLWQIEINDFDGFERPYIGNGIFGTRFDKLIIGTDENLLWNISRAVYDNGKQLRLAPFNHIDFNIGGVKYTADNGKHSFSQILDMRNAVVSMTDEWEYKNGKTVTVRTEMFIPRTFGHVSFLSFAVSGIKEAAKIKFGITTEGVKGYKNYNFISNHNTLNAVYQTEKQSRDIKQAIKWKSEGLGKTSQNFNFITADVESENFTLELFHGITSYEEKDNVLDKVTNAYNLGRDELYKVNHAAWKKIWENAIAYRTDDKKTEKCMIVHQFYLLCSLEVCDYPLGPLGLSKNEWGGNQLWDADLWVFRAILPLWQDFAKSIIMFRYKTLEGAKNHAKYTGYKGAWYAWMTDEEGNDITPVGFKDELHVNIWIALAAWEYYLHTKDTEYLSEIGFTLMSEISDFFVSRTLYKPDGKYHIDLVLGPDEAVYECGTMRVNDNFLTNYGVKKVLQSVIKASDILQKKPKAEWLKVEENIFLQSPDMYGIYPEYTGYNGHGIKQADVILTFYPLGLNADRDIIFKNIRFYKDKQMYYGPLMSSQIEACIMMKYGDKEGGIKRLFSGMDEFERGKHFISYECRDLDNDNSIMLTGVAGEMQALIYGLYGADVENTDNIPKMKEFME